MPLTKLAQDEDGNIPEGVRISKTHNGKTSIDFAVVRTRSGKKVDYLHVSINVAFFDTGSLEDGMGTTYFYMSKAEVRKLCKILGKFAV